MGLDTYTSGSPVSLNEPTADRWFCFLFLWSASPSSAATFGNKSSASTTATINGAYILPLSVPGCISS